MVVYMGNPGILARMSCITGILLNTKGIITMGAVSFMR